MFKVSNFISALCSGFIFALLAGALVSYWVWLEMRVHTWVICWFVLALFLIIATMFKIKPITFFIGEALVILLMVIKSPNIFFYNVRDMFFLLDMKKSDLQTLTYAIMGVMTVMMVIMWFLDHKEKNKVN